MLPLRRGSMLDFHMGGKRGMIEDESQAEIQPDGRVDFGTLPGPHRIALDDGYTKFEQWLRFEVAQVDKIDITFKATRLPSFYFLFTGDVPDLQYARLLLCVEGKEKAEEIGRNEFYGYWLYSFDKWGTKCSYQLRMPRISFARSPCQINPKHRRQSELLIIPFIFHDRSRSSVK